MADNTPSLRRSRRIKNRPPSQTGELPPARRRRTQQHTASPSLSTTIRTAGTGSSHVPPTEPSAASTSFLHEDTPTVDTGSSYAPPTEPSAASPPESPAPTGPRLIARAAHRNVHIFDNQTPPVEIGGLHVTRGVSKSAAIRHDSNPCC